MTIEIHVTIEIYVNLRVSVIITILLGPPTDGEKEVGTVNDLQENKIYSRGNHKDFTAFLQRLTNKDNPKVAKNIL